MSRPSESGINWSLIALAGGAACVLIAVATVVLVLGRATKPVDPPLVFLPPSNPAPRPAPPVTIVHVTKPSVEILPSPKPVEVETPVVAAPPAVEPTPAPTPQPVKVTFKRIQRRSGEELTRDLVKIPEVDIEDKRGTIQNVVEFGRANRMKFPHPFPEPLLRRSDIGGLPLKMGVDCHLSKEAGQNLQVLSRKLRVYMAQAVNANANKAATVGAVAPALVDPRPDPAELCRLLLNSPEGARGDWTSPDAIPALVQLLQAEDRPIRLLLVRMLAEIHGRDATEALAQRAVFDLAEDVREAAIAKLAARPIDDIRPSLLKALRYQWAPAADHASEALVALNDAEAVADLKKLLELPDPSAVRLSTTKQPVVEEVVRINHLRNCTLCHAPSFDTNDLVRGLTPTPGVAVPPVFSTQYYDSPSPRSLFVRADITYLKQDFAVPQPVANNGVWPAFQRYDYTVRRRAPTYAELNAAKPKDYPQKQAVQFAIRNLTKASE